MCHFLLNWEGGCSFDFHQTAGIDINFLHHLPFGQVRLNFHLSEWKILLSETMNAIKSEK
jgi:hypothetical protein